MAKNGKKEYMFAVGRRKTASARVRFYKSAERDGEVEVNGVKYDEYFPANFAHVVMDPLQTIDGSAGGYFTVKVQGGGPSSQAEAVRHGMTRILVEVNEDWKSVLKKRGFLRRDPRMKERKKPGLRRARRAPQWSKR